VIQQPLQEASMPKRAFAIGAHPDDIEFMMAGTLILLGQAGYELHYMTIANGSCGTTQYTYDEIVEIRGAEARAAASFISAIYHEPLVNDLDIFYEKPLLARLTAVMREVAPEILLVHAPIDYMEDHQNAARLAVSAAFCRGMPNFPTDPPRAPVSQEVTVYHAQPHSNLDPMRQTVVPDFFVDVSGVMDTKRDMLAKHVSQKAWLDESQGMDSYLISMTDAGRAAGAMSGVFEYAEGWRRRLHFGFCAEGADPLGDALGNAVARATVAEPGR
jgi:LmbE family N-acetylglucosaminyl deacetylase